ncbi:Alpha/beta hydrolase related protein [Striga hermonthica]|uniref:Alpha/beta hydrolase related protein n=1 Tax=Striga hermonthica TaxID=68872 RepID=A0A9N7RM53_STRHE|nr:Alpha/beta hydrolase related protein [Striga hermonthica]
MGILFKEDKSPTKRPVVVVVVPRWVKALFFLITMLISLLLFSAPVLLVIADALLPSAFMSAALRPAAAPPLGLRAISDQLSSYDFRSSLVDIPIVSVIRSAIILCVYSFCDGPRLSNGPYLGVATACSAASLVFVSLKASYVFVSGGGYWESTGYVRAMVAAMFVSSLGLAVGHVVVAYRTSCRERRKLLVYKIDIEAVSACKNGFPRYQKILQEARKK